MTTLTSASPPEVPSEIKRQVEVATRGTAIVVPKRLSRPHRIIAGWLASHEQAQVAAGRESDPILRAMKTRPDWTESDHRQHRILDTLFKGAEKQGLGVKEESHRNVYIESEGEQIVFNLREKMRRVLRLPTTEE